MCFQPFQTSLPLGAHVQFLSPHHVSRCEGGMTLWAGLRVFTESSQSSTHGSENQQASTFNVANAVARAGEREALIDGVTIQVQLKQKRSNVSVCSIYQIYWVMSPTPARCVLQPNNDSQLFQLAQRSQAAAAHFRSHKSNGITSKTTQQRLTLKRTPRLNMHIFYPLFFIHTLTYSHPSVHGLMKISHNECLESANAQLNH